jgi:hypothetical protein
MKLSRILVAGVAAGLLVAWGPHAAAQAMNARLAAVLSGVKPVPQGGAGGGGGGGPTPVFVWATQGGVTTAASNVTTSKGANSITAGGFAVATLILTENTGVSHSVACPTGFTPAPGGWSPSFDGNTNHAKCYKVMDAGDTGGAFQFTWSSATASTTGQWTLMYFTGATSIEVSANAATATAPTVTSLGTNRLLLSCSGMAGSSPTVTSEPSGMTHLFTAAGGSLAREQCASLSMPTAGASGAKVWTWSQGNSVQSDNAVIAP